MNKWIAEFDLEDGDTMPEHMDLKYKGVKIDFHCKPLDQEPFINKPCVSSGVCEHDKQKVLEKIRAEIEKAADISNRLQGISEIGLRKALKILDKYKAESEGKGMTRREYDKIIHLMNCGALQGIDTGRLDGKCEDVIPLEDAIAIVDLVYKAETEAEDGNVD